MTKQTKKSKIKTYEPKTIEQAVNILQTFFEVDLWTKFYPKDNPLNKKSKKYIWYRTDYFISKQDMLSYLDEHFDILRRRIRKLRSEK